MTETPLDESLIANAPAPRKKIFTTITAEPGQYKGRLLPIIIGIAMFMATLTATVIANALPSIARDLHQSPLTLNMAITVYLLTNACFLPISGWAADRFGARTVFASAMVLYMFSSVLCGFSHTLWQLVASRALQGVAGAMMMPVGRLVLLKSVAKSDLVRAMSYLTMPSMLGPVVGPPIGGFIVTYFHWSWIFFINVPVGIISLFLVLTFIPNIKEDVKTDLDWKGFLLTGLGLAGLIYGFENVGRGFLPNWAVAAMLLGGAAAMTIYVYHEKRSTNAMLDLDLFRNTTFTTSIVGGLFPRLMIGATPFLLALLLQVGFGMSAFAAGMLTFTSAAGALLMKVAAQPIIRWFGFKQVLIGNAFIVAATFMAYAFFTPTTPHSLMIFILLTGGFFRSLGLTALQSLTFADVPQERMSRATVMMSMSQPLAQSIGIGSAAMMVHAFSAINHDGAHIQAHSITPAFLILGFASLSALFWYIPLPKNVAEEVSGHVGKKRWEREAEAEARAEAAAAGDETELSAPIVATVQGLPAPAQPMRGMEPQTTELGLAFARQARLWRDRAAGAAQAASNTFRRIAQ